MGKEVGKVKVKGMMGRKRNGMNIDREDISVRNRNKSIKLREFSIKDEIERKRANEREVKENEAKKKSVTETKENASGIKETAGWEKGQGRNKQANEEGDRTQGKGPENNDDRDSEDSMEIEDRIKVTRKTLPYSTMIKVSGRLRYEEDIKEDEIGQGQEDDKIYSSNHVGLKVVEASIIPSARSSNNDTNKLKIIKYVSNRRYKVVEIKDKGFARFDLIFNSLVEANECLRDKKGTKEGTIEFVIPREKVQCKGVVTGWEAQLSLEEFGEALGDIVTIKRIERLKSRYYDRDTREIVENPTSGIIITWEGSRLPEHIAIYNGLVRLKVRPFVPMVKQCFKCYRYGHFKVHCRNRERCKVCGEDFHGRCDRELKCINCGGNHMSNDKRCDVYLYNRGLKRTMAEN